MQKLSLDLESLRYGATLSQAISYDFGADNNAHATMDGSGWCVAERSTPLALWLDGLEETKKTLPCGTVLELDPDDGWISIEPSEEPGEGISTFVYSESPYYEPDEAEYPALAKLLGIDPPPDAEEDDECQWDPMMHFAWPLPSEPDLDWTEAMECCTVVLIDGDAFLALTGGGMDLSWGIAESYIRLGWLPPSALELPRMAGRGDSELDRFIIEAMRRSHQHVADCAASRIARLDDLSRKGAA